MMNKKIKKSKKYIIFRLSFRNNRLKVKIINYSTKFDFVFKKYEKLKKKNPTKSYGCGVRGST